jgi:hypothetical protein
MAQLAQVAGALLILAAYALAQFGVLALVSAVALVTRPRQPAPSS